MPDQDVYPGAVGPDDDPIVAPDIGSLLRLARVEMVDDGPVRRTAFRGRVRPMIDGWPFLYGGQVAAQALIAAGCTVPEPRVPHSLHGYFLRAGRSDRLVEFIVDHDRDGGSFSARHVSAVQEGRVIFSMLASFSDRTAPEALDAVRRSHTSPPPPDSCPRHELDPFVEVRQVTPARQVGDRTLHPDAIWAKAPAIADHGPLAQAALLTYLSDFGTGFGQSLDPGLGTGGPSLDHAVWFHQPIDPHDWVLLDMWPVSASGGRGLYHGSLRESSGRLGATIAQEMLFRPAR